MPNGSYLLKGKLRDLGCANCKSVYRAADQSSSEVNHYIADVYLGHQECMQFLIVHPILYSCQLLRSKAPYTANPLPCMVSM